MINFRNIYDKILKVGEVQRQTIVSFSWQILFTIIGFLSTIYFARTVGPSILGAYFLFIAYNGIISTFTDGGLSVAAVKRISEGLNQNEYFSAYLFLNLLFTVVAVVALLVTQNYFVDLKEENIFIWLVVAQIAFFLFKTFATGVAGCGKMGIQSTCNFLNDITRVISQVVAVYLGFKVSGLAGGFVAGLLIATIMDARFFDLKMVRFKKEHVKSLLTFSFWMFLTSGGVMMYSYADTILIGYFMKNADVGIYRIILQFASFAMIATAALRGTLWPKISRWNKTGEQKMIEKSLSRAITYSFVFAMPICMGGIVIGNKAILYLYGETFAGNYIVLLTLLLVQIVNIFQYFFTTYLGALDLQKEAFKVTFISTLSNILLNILLIPLYGIEGAAFATLVTMASNTYLAYRILGKQINIYLEKRSIINIFKASTLMVISVGMTEILIELNNIISVLIVIIGGAMIYGYFVMRLNKDITTELTNIFLRMV